MYSAKCDVKFQSKSEIFSFRKTQLKEEREIDREREGEKVEETSAN